MRNQALLTALLFLSLTFLFFSLYGLILTLTIAEGPAQEGPTKKGTPLPQEEPEEMLHFGSRSSGEAVPNVFDASERAVSFVTEENNESLSRPQEISIEEINALLDTPERCMELTGHSLIGTGLAIPESESFALINASSKKQGKGVNDEVSLLRIDEELDTGIMLAAIRRNLVAFKTPAGVRCLGENVGKNATGTGLVEEKKESSGNPNDLNVQQIGQNAYRLSRDDLTKATSNLNSLATQARIVPDRKENGFKIFSIKPDSIWQKIGIQNGDVIKSINGIELSSPDKALEAYSRLRNANKLSLDLVRRGKRETLDYSVD